jgi:hypothetical protein
VTGLSCEAVSQAIQTVLDHPETARTMAKNAIALAGLFSWEAAGARLVDLYHHILLESAPANSFDTEIALRRPRSCTHNMVVRCGQLPNSTPHGRHGDDQG